MYHTILYFSTSHTYHHFIVFSIFLTSYTTGFMNTVRSVYTLLVNTIYLSLSTQVAEGTVFSKQTVLCTPIFFYSLYTYMHWTYDIQYIHIYPHPPSIPQELLPILTCLLNYFKPRLSPKVSSPTYRCILCNLYWKVSVSWSRTFHSRPLFLVCQLEFPWRPFQHNMSKYRTIPQRESRKKCFC